MLRFLTALILIGGIAYLANYFFDISKSAYFTNGAYRQMNAKPCGDVANAFNGVPDDPERKKAETYLNELAESRYSVVNLQTLNGEQWQKLVQAFQRTCAANPGLPGEEIMTRIPAEDVNGLKSKDTY